MKIMYCFQQEVINMNLNYFFSHARLKEREITPIIITTIKQRLCPFILNSIKEIET